MPVLSAPPRTLAEPAWRGYEDAHHERADRLTAGHRARSSRGEKHPVEDFLFTYYSYKPAVLRRWHPGESVALEGAALTPRLQWRWYAEGPADALHVDGTTFREERGLMLTGISRILAATASRPASYGCFGLHEWAMVFRQAEHRHPVPLRLSQGETDDVVASHELRCTHFDAFRFFTPDAVPLNRDLLTRDDQPRREQPGCLHAGMDLYKWAIKLGPLVPGDLLLDAFELARDIRTLDMRASPYDLTAWGYAPVPIETAAGKADYVSAQRGFSARAAVVRERLRAVIDESAHGRAVGAR